MDRKAHYAAVMWLDNSLLWRSEVLLYPQFRNGYSDIVFVASEEHAKGFPEDVIVAWPSVMTEGMLKIMNKEAIARQLDLSKLPLAHPWTMTDVLEKWEAFIELLRILDRSFHHSVMRQAEQEMYTFEAINNSRIRRWLAPGRLEKLNEIIKDKDISKHGLTWPVTEDDVRQKLEDVSNLVNPILMTRDEIDAIDSV